MFALTARKPFHDTRMYQLGQVTKPSVSVFFICEADTIMVPTARGGGRGVGKDLKNSTQQLMQSNTSVVFFVIVVVIFL